MAGSIVMLEHSERGGGSMAAWRSRCVAETHGPRTLRAAQPSQTAVAAPVTFNASYLNINFDPIEEPDLSMAGA